jgi:hypothetical protein
MTVRPVLADERSPRLAIVEEHVRLENEHNLEGVIQTFGEAARYDDEPWNKRGRTAAVASFVSPQRK